MRDPAEALRLTDRAARLGAPDRPALSLTISAALAELGQTDQAIAAARQALAAARDPRQAAEIEALIECYRQGRTYRDFAQR